MIIPGHAHRLRQALVMDCGFEHHALVKLGHHLALDLLPRRLALRILVAPVLSERGPAFVELSVRDQDISRALPEIDAYPVARLEERQTASRRGLGGGVEDRGRAGGAGLPSVAAAGKRVAALLVERGRRLHFVDFGSARLAYR